ncbi:MAG TPA: glycosyl hydrolase family 39 [Verrucomicrobiae bacterium]|nr:glycosyl hydrolase family 39 [Verrucomicrobiae bacterium]
MTAGKTLMKSVRLAAALMAFCVLAQHAPGQETLLIDGSAPAHAFPHFWEQMFGSGRAVLALRDAYQRDLRQVKAITGVSYVRFHAILHDELGVYDEDAQGRPRYNFSYVDQIYDGLLAQGVRPFIELSFMPRKLAARDMPHPFWYKPNVSPPKDWAKWDGLITEFTKHLVERYGKEEVSRWYFEVWNEPNLDFWGGDPKQATYWELYDHTARALKAVLPSARVGGPATAQAAWVVPFIRHCVENSVPVDFVSTHVYGNDRAQDVFGTDEAIARNQMVPRSVKKVHDQIKASARPDLPLIWSEFNASYMNEPAVTDSLYMGPWLADTICQCDGNVDILAYWTFSDVFEEQGVVKTPFYGGFGLIAAGGIPKPAFNAFQLLHRLGTERLDLQSDSALLTRTPRGALVLALWNYAPPDQPGATKHFVLNCRHTNARVRLTRLDATHGDFHATYQAMQSPQYPTAAQIANLRAAAQLAPAENLRLKNGRLEVTLPCYGLALIEFE